MKTLLLAALLCFCQQELYSLVQSDLDRELQEHPYLPEILKQRIHGHLLPADHDARPFLDALYSQNRVTQDRRSFTDAGFILLRPTKNHGRLIGYHPSLPDFIIKALSDGYKFNEALLFRRAEAAKEMRQVIGQYQLSYVRVPETYVYLLPEEFPRKSTRYRKNFLIVQERLDILSGRERDYYWSNPEVWSEAFLDELFTFMMNVSISDLHGDNVLLTSDLQQVAFIDLERSGNSGEACHYIFQSLPKRWQPYWRELQRNYRRQKRS